jgi:AraC family transcriptional regulator
MSPAQFRRHRPSLTITGKVDKNSLMPIASSLIFKPRYIFKPKFYICGIKHHEMSGEEVIATNLAANLAMDFYFNRKQEIKNYPCLFL